MSSPKEREKRERSKSSGANWKIDETQGKVNDSEETAKIRTSPFQYLLQAQQASPNCKPISAERPDAKRYMTSLPHPPPQEPI